jgi:hypothetical protein
MSIETAKAVTTMKLTSTQGMENWIPSPLNWPLVNRLWAMPLECGGKRESEQSGGSRGG